MFGKHKKLVIVILVFLSIIVIGFGTWYNIRNFKRGTPIAEKPVENIPETPIVSPDTTSIEADVVAPSTEVEDAIEISSGEDLTSIETTPLEFPRIILLDAPDVDADTLTDEEEILFETDSGVWDNDGDGYYDGQEILNLYNPKGFAPAKLIDSGLVSEYVHPGQQYRLYYPVSWQVGNVVAGGEEYVLVSALSGDFIEVRRVKKIPTDSFQTWFAKSVTGERYQDLNSITNRFKELLWMRRDGLVAYSDVGDSVYVLVYHPGSEQHIVYRSVMRMMIESFRPRNNTHTLPEQVILPTPPTESPLTEVTTSTTTL